MSKQTKKRNHNDQEQLDDGDEQGEDRAEAPAEHGVVPEGVDVSVP